MKIRRLDIERWRNLESLAIEPIGSPTVVCLAGENGTGKSNLLEIVSSTLVDAGLGGSTVARRGRANAPNQETHDVTLTLELPSSERAELLTHSASPSGLSSTNGTAASLFNQLPSPAGEMSRSQSLDSNSTRDAESHNWTAAASVAPNNLPPPNRGRIKLNMDKPFPSAARA